ncbi:MAG: TrbI/VirB10 family protein [bacterium]
MKEKIIGVINKAKEIKNLNELARIAQNKIAYLVIAGLGVFIFAGWFFMHSRGDTAEKSKKPDTEESAQMDGAVDAQFDQESSKKALDGQQVEIKSLNEKLTEMSNQIDLLQSSLAEKKQEELSDGNVTLQELQTKVTELETALLKKSQPELGARTEMESAARGITTTSFSYTGDQNLTSGMQDTKIKTVKDYVPPGTFAKAVLLSGADTNAGVHGQTDTTPITMRILDNGTLPNGEHSSLKGCFVTAAAYGDASSERGQIRLQRLSCVKKSSGLILDIPIEGTINDMGGNDGIRGHVVMRNNKLIWNAGVSGVLSGIGNAMQQSVTTQSVSPLGVTSSAIQPNKVFQHGAFGGANSALGKLADYYIKLADMYHPIVQIHAGSQVNIVFLKGFSLTEGQGASDLTPSLEKAKNNTQDGTQNLMQTIKGSQVGQAVNVGNDNNEEMK